MQKAKYMIREGEYKMVEMDYREKGQYYEIRLPGFIFS